MLRSLRLPFPRLCKVYFGFSTAGPWCDEMVNYSKPDPAWKPLPGLLEQKLAETFDPCMLKSDFELDSE